MIILDLQPESHLGWIHPELKWSHFFGKLELTIESDG